eukprot:2645436-Rhodomonas_salina.1
MRLMVPTAELPKVTETEEEPVSSPVSASNATTGMLARRMVATRSIESSLVSGAPKLSGGCEEAQRPLDRHTLPELHLTHVETERACGAGMK